MSGESNSATIVEATIASDQYVSRISEAAGTICSTKNGLPPVRDAINAHLRPAPVAVLSAERVSAAFDARHSAVRRHYRYLIVNRRPPLALERHAWQVPAPLDAEPPIPDIEFGGAPVQKGGDTARRPIRLPVFRGAAPRLTDQTGPANDRRAYPTSRNP